MCFSSHKTESKNLKNEFKGRLQERRQLVKQREISNFLLFRIKFMELVLASKLRTSAKNQDKDRSICGDRKMLNVRPEFQTAFEECSTREQMKYYSLAIKQLNSKGNELLMSEPVNCKAEVIGFFKWKSVITMRIFPDKFRVQIIEVEDNQKKHTFINLRNYFFRKSKNIRKFTYVIEALNSVTPETVRFSLLQGDKPLPEIEKILEETATNAFIENVRNWKKEVIHIPPKTFDKKALQIYYGNVEQSIHNITKKEQEDKWEEITRQIVFSHLNKGEQSQVKQPAYQSLKERPLKKKFSISPITSSIYQANPHYPNERTNQKSERFDSISRINQYDSQDSSSRSFHTLDGQFCPN